jgi:hypothetical protein
MQLFDPVAFEQIPGQIAMNTPPTLHLFYIGRCPVKGCKHAERHEDGVNADIYGRCPDHGVYPLTRGGGYYSDKVKCGARCVNAIGPSCDCSCGGHNHGIGHVR